MRLVLAFLALVGCVALFAVSVPSMLVGYAEQRHADQAYVVGFVPGSGCGDGHELYLRTEDGAVLDCVSVGLSGSGNVRLPGFTDEQDEQVETLAEQLGSDGLSAVEQGEIQGLVDSIVAMVAPAERPYGDQAVWGAGRIWLGAGMFLAAVLGAGGVLWLIARSAPPGARRTARGR